jgi:hypothetical protein
MKHLFITAFWLFIAIPQPVSSQGWAPVGARSSALGSASVALIDPLSVHNNQAALVFLKETAITVSYENVYQLPGTANQHISGFTPIGKGVIGAQISYTGDQNQNSLFTGLAFARKLGYRFSAGISLDILRISIAEGYGSKILPTFETAIMAKVSDNLTIGSHIYNPVQVRLGNYADERLPAVVSFGLSYDYSTATHITVETRKVSRFPMELISGIEHQFQHQVSARVGFASSPARYTMGFGFRKGKFEFDIATAYHTFLGFSPQATATYRIKTK